MGRFVDIFIDQFRTISTLQGTENPGYVWMWILMVVLVIGILISLERFFFLWMKAGSVNAEKFMANVMKHSENKDFEKAHEFCRKAKGSSLPYVIGKGVAAAKAKETAEFRIVQNGVDTAMMEIMPQLQARTAYINLIGSVATLIGLAGTIFGLILAFDAVGQPGIPEAQKSQMLASGISAAMGTTIAGLFIAIPMNILYTVIIGKISKIIDDIDEWSVKFVNLVQR